jgi:UMF1 family MFS transporter
MSTVESPAAAPPKEHKPSRLAVTGWVLYDLANTIFALGVISLYFPLWVVNVMGGEDADVAYALSISMAVIFVLSPVLGALTDQSPRRMPFLAVATLICVGFTLLFGQGGLALSLVFFGVANIAYQAGLQFYDALLPEVSTEANRGKIGGIGVGVGYMGSIVAIIAGQILIGDVEGLSQAEQSARYTSTFQAVGVLFLLFALPCFLFVRERPRKNRQFSLASVGAAVRQVGETVRTSGRYPGLVRFLVGRVFYTDAVNTVIAFLGIYVTNEVGFSQEEARIVLLVSIIFSIAGGLLWSQVIDRWQPKRTLDVVLFLWMFIFAMAAAVGFFNWPGQIIWGVAVLAGIALGGTWTADRPYMLRLTPPSRIGEFYGLYGMVGRFAAITGPLAWGLIVNELEWGRPAAIVMLLIQVIISYIILRGVSDKPRDWSAAERGEDGPESVVQ